MKLYLSRLSLASNRVSYHWLSNPYHVHQRLMMGADGDPRLLFRIEQTTDPQIILVQTHSQPIWEKAFADFPVLAKPAEVKEFEPNLTPGAVYRFRLLANPTIKKDGKRFGIIREMDQINWLERKLQTAGGRLLGCHVMPRSKQLSIKKKENGGSITHLAALFEGQFTASETQRLEQAIADGIGSAKGFGFGLLSVKVCSQL